jgi:hypothetical protein
MKGLMAGALSKGLKSGAAGALMKGVKSGAAGALTNGLKSGAGDLSKAGDSAAGDSKLPVVSSVVKAANTVVNGKAQAAQVADLLHNPNVRKAAQNLVDVLKAPSSAPSSPLGASPAVAAAPIVIAAPAPAAAPAPVAAPAAPAKPHVGGRRKTKSKGKGKGKKSRKSKSTKRR